MNLQKYSPMFVKKKTRMVCGTCKYRVEKAWKNYSHGSVGATERLLKRKHPVSPLTSSQDDEQTVRRIERKTASHRLVFDDSKTTILPKATELSAPQIKSTREAGSQTVKSSCHCWQSSAQGTCVKVCTISELQLSVNKCKLHLSTDKTVHS